MERTQKNDFTQGTVWKVILRMAIPMMLAQIVNVAYNIVDRMYIGHMPGSGSLALTGLGLCMPIISIITAFSALCGVGGGPLCSIARGRGDLPYAEKVMGNALTMLLLIGAALTVLLRIFMKPVLCAMGASEATFPYAAQYANIYILGTIFVMIAHGMNYFINAQGFARVGMLTVAIGAAMNIILDPIFIFALDMGITGAALATVLSQAVSAAWAMRFLMSKRAILDLKLQNLRLDWGIVKRILALGATGFVMSVTNGIVQMAYNIELRVWGGDLYVGAMTIINSVREVSFSACSGLRDGAQPVLGFNYGAGVYSRVKKAIRFISGFSIVYAAAVWVLILIFAEPIVRIFNSEPGLIAAAAPAMRVHFSGYIFMSLMMAGQSVFLSLGKSKQAVTFSILRKVVIVTPLIFLLPRIASWGVMGVFWAEPISDIIGGGASFLTMIFTVYRRLGNDVPVLKEGEAA